MLCAIRSIEARLSFAVGGSPERSSSPVRPVCEYTCSPAADKTLNRKFLKPFAEPIQSRRCPRIFKREYKIDPLLGSLRRRSARTRGCPGNCGEVVAQ